MVMRVAIAGATSKALGQYIARAFVERANEFHVTLLIRQAALEQSKALVEELTAAGARTAIIDGKPPAELAKLLQGIDTVVSAVSGAGFAWQLDLVEAAKLAGVKTFVPSEFGVPLDYIERGSIERLNIKFETRDELEASSMRPIYISTGLFLEYFLRKGLFDWESGKVTIHGSGKPRLPITSVHDIATWLPDIVLAPEPAKATYLVGNVVSWNGIVAAHNKATGKSLDVTYVPVDALKALAAQPVTPDNMMKVFLAQVALTIESGAFDDMQPSHPPGTKEPRTPLDFFSSAANAA